MSEPTWELLGGGGVVGGPIDYVGAWAAGTTYQPGQVVRYGGIDYLAVNPSLGQTPPPAIPLGPGYGTTLPAAPFDGQEFTLVDSITNPSYVWRFRYNAGSTSAYKWEFVGGSPASAALSGGASTASVWSTFVPLDGPAITVARAGDYTVDWSTNAYNGTQGHSAMAYAGVSATYENEGLIYATAPVAGTYLLVLARRARLNAVPAGGTIRLWYCTYTAGTAYYERRQLHVTPVRVA